LPTTTPFSLVITVIAGIFSSAPLVTDSGGDGPFPLAFSNIDINDPADANGPESTTSPTLPPLLAELIVPTLSALLTVFLPAAVGLVLRLAASIAAMRLWFFASICACVGPVAAARPRCAA
jgi:hypothetical protein